MLGQILVSIAFLEFLNIFSFLLWVAFLDISSFSPLGTLTLLVMLV